MSRFAAEAAKGAAYLDTIEPGWFRRIDVPSLHMNDCEDCIRGQLFGRHYSDRGVPENVAKSIAHRSHWMRDHGFDLWGIDHDQTRYQAAWDDLKAAWVAEINKRLEAAAHENRG